MLPLKEMDSQCSPAFLMAKPENDQEDFFDETSNFFSIFSSVLSENDIHSVKFEKIQKLEAA